MDSVMRFLRMFFQEELEHEDSVCSSPWPAQLGMIPSIPKIHYAKTFIYK